MRTLPFWAKLTSCLVVGGYVTAVIVITQGLAYMIDTSRRAGDPVYIAQVLNSICDMSEWPEGFHCELAVNLFNVQNMITVNHKADGTSLLLGTMPPEPALSDPQKLVDTLAGRGNPYVFREFKVDKAGAEIVAGQKFEYVMGPARDRDGRSGSGLIGCAMPQGKKKVVVLYGFTPARSYNLDATKQFLHAIKGF